MRKLFVTLLLFGLAFSSCNSQKHEKSAPQYSKNTPAIVKIELSERTRGYSRSISVTPEMTKRTVNRQENNSRQDKELWDKITAETQKIDVENIASFPAPSEKRRVDAALASWIVITTKNETYSSVSFDSGNPPLELKALYKILSAQFSSNEKE